MLMDTEEDAYFGFPRHWCDFANLSTLQGVDHRTFPDIGIPDEADTYLLLIAV